jgi:biotin operon repressor
VDKELKKTLKKGGRAAVEKQVDQLREVRGEGVRG